MSRDSSISPWTCHKKAVVIAVLNSSGKLGHGVDCRNQIRSILQFITVSRGELHVTWEERDLGILAPTIWLQPQVAQVLVLAIRGAMPY